jgi:hypothetical protein
MQRVRVFAIVVLAMLASGCPAPVAMVDAARADSSEACAPLRRASGVEIAMGELGRSGAPVAIDDFCASYGDALCHAPPGCGCGADAPLNCFRHVAARCDDSGGALGPAMRASIDLGRATYDAEAAGRLIQAVRDASADCAHAPSSIDLDLLIVLTGTVHGELAPGAPCDATTPFECVLGSECLGAPAACTGARAPCAALAVCESDELHAPRLVCSGDACDHGAPPGAACSPTCATVCDEAGSATSCACAIEDGATCASDRECQSGDCIAAVCGAPAMHLGEVCADGQACAEGTCAAGVCRSWQCGGGWY